MKHFERHKILRIAVLFFIYAVLTVQSQNSNTDLNNTSSLLSDGNVTISTLRPKHNCTPPAIEQFPNIFMSQWTRNHGGVVLHILLAAYSFVALAIVCDDYFVASLEAICEDLNMSPDVAGATFMAAGTSAPELAAVFIGVFCAKDDIGISGAIGSAEFNIMFVISVCSLATTTACYLNWWPIVRDSFFYAVSIIFMLFTILDNYVSWDEALLLLMLYTIYCVFLYFNPQLERWSQALTSLRKNDVFDEEYTLIERERQNGTKCPRMNISITDKNDRHGLLGSVKSDIEYTDSGEFFCQDLQNSKEASTHIDPLSKPVSGFWAHIYWAIVYPIHLINKLTMPNCRLQQYRKWYPLTFLVSIIWIVVYSYIMIWMITIIGTTLGIPDTVMGLTFLAAGVSVPDALAGVAVIKQGHGNMAVANAIGSNVFDILVCLGLPWFIQTAMVEPGSQVYVASKGLTYSTIMLFLTVIFLLLATHLNGWKLDRRFGIILMIWYLICTVIASLYELNVFGKLNPPTCSSAY